MNRDALVSEGLVLLVTATAVGALMVSRGLPLRVRALASTGCLLVAALWLYVSQEVEGRVFFQVTDGHGLAAADLAAVPLLVVAALVLRRR